MPSSGEMKYKSDYERVAESFRMRGMLNREDVEWVTEQYTDCDIYAVCDTCKVTGIYLCERTIRNV